MNTFEKEIIRHCSPTLAGIKTGNLFSYHFADYYHLIDEITEWNHSLNSRGVYFEILKINASRALIYVYRKNVCFMTFHVQKLGVFLTRLATQPEKWNHV